MPYPKKTDRPKQVLVSIPTSLLVEVDLYLHDPFTGKPRYGARSKLIERLLRGWVAEQRKQLKGYKDGA